MKNPKYYNYDKIWKRYRVSKTINKRRVSYGTYETEEEAQMVVAELKKVNWDKSQLTDIKKRLGIKCVRKINY